MPPDEILTARGLFLDLDGTLADTLPVMRDSFDRFMTRFGLPATQEEFDSFNGPPLREIVRTLRARYALGQSADALLEIYNTMIDEAYQDAPPFPGARDFLERARAHGFATSVVTSSSRSRTFSWLDRHGLSGLIDLIVTGEDVGRGKPDPEPYALALARSGCGPAGSIAVEDSPKGAQSALAAGIPTWLVSHGGAPETVPAGVRLASGFAEIGLLP